MMLPFLTQIKGVSIGTEELFHQPHSPHFLLVRSDMQALYAQPLLYGKEFCIGTVHIPFFRCDLHRPVKICPGYKVRQPDCHSPAHIPFAGEIHPPAVCLTPEALHGRHHIGHKTVYLMLRPVAHFQCAPHRIQDGNRLLEQAVLQVGIARTTNHCIMRFRHCQNHRFVLGHI